MPDDRKVLADLSVGENLEIVARPGMCSGWDKDKLYDFSHRSKPSTAAKPDS
ncbi:hypothetical protein DFAR_1990009 [Desulfarculales bacterium]